MSQGNSYKIPADNICVEQEIKRSRFIASIGRAPDKQKAYAFIEKIRATFPDAKHHCWAYVAGNPVDTNQVGMSDDGEPHGTAGKPMLSVLQFSKIGEIVAVVSRYFGGIKLGGGGLVRAYSSSVQMALQKLPLEEFIASAPAQITLPYPHENSIRRLLNSLKVDIVEVIYTDSVGLIVEVARDIAAELERQIIDQTRGSAKIDWITEPNPDAKDN
ncbi:MAG: YigZ family protein [Deltaproteobacteria bacterium]|nr:YigZ family protein [Deltaproteobacteria bacterium]